MQKTLKKSSFKLLLSIVLLAMVLALVPATALGAEFNDTKGHWADAVINKWSGEGLLNGYTDNTFRPNAPITRAEYIAVIARIFGYEAKGSCPFDDVKASDWFCKAVTAAYEKGVVNGDGKNFRPNDYITRQEAMAIFSRAFALVNKADACKNFADLAQIASWALGPVGAMTDAGYVKGYSDNTIRPLANITRAETVQIVDNASALVKSAMDKADTPATDTPATDTPAADTPATNTPVSPSRPIKPTPKPDPKPEQNELEKALTPYGETVKVDPARGTLTAYNGYYSGTLAENAGTYKEYIPENYRRQTFQIILTVPDGLKTEEFLLNSGWKDLADKYAFDLFVLEFDWGKDAAADQAYITAALAKKGSAANPASSSVVGYGTGGTALQQYVMTHTSTFASAAFVEASDIDGSFLSATAGATISYGSSDDDNKIVNGEIPLPVWIIESYLSNDVNAVVDYWQTANHSASQSTPFHGGELFAQSEEIFYTDEDTTHSATPNGLIASVATLEKAVDVEDKELAQMLYEGLLSKYMRYGGTIWSNVVIPIPDYEEMGVALKQYPQTLDGVTYMRDYLVYQPAGYEKQDLPVVFLFHGANQGYNNIFDCSGWYEVADDYGIIIVSVSGLLSKTEVVTGSCPSFSHDSSESGLQFMADLLTQIKKDYSVDASRVYTCGMSAGSGFAQTCGVKMPELFAAVGSVSMMSNVAPDTTPSDLPVYVIVGENDMDYYDYTNVEKGAKCLNMILARLNASGVAATGVADLPAATDLTGFYQGFDRYNVVQFNGADGEPIVRRGWAFNRGHSGLFSDYRNIWETWLQYWTLNTKNGEHIYNQPATQAVTDFGFYGQKLFQVVLTYPEKLDAKAIDENTFTVLDYPQNYDNGLKHEAIIDSVEVDGNQVKINIADVYEANPVGTLVAVNWNIDPEGNIFKDGALGYWHNSDVHTEVKLNADLYAADGSLLAYATSANLCMSEATQQNKFDQFVNIKDELGLQIANGDYVQGYLHLPENAGNAGNTDKYPIMLTLCGGGTTYGSKTIDGVFYEKPATGLAMDKASVAWLDADEPVIVAAMSTTGAEQCIKVIETLIADYNGDPDRVYLNGNSAGCSAGANVIKARPDLIAAYVNNNGGFNYYMFEGTAAWTDQQIQAIFDNNIAVLYTAGETDNEKPRNTQNQYLKMVETYRDLGYSEEWIYDNVRLYGYPHSVFAYWGVTDHSATKVTYYYWFDKGYNNPTFTEENAGKVLAVGDTYTLPNILTTEKSTPYNISGVPYGEYQYEVYKESVMDWVLSRSRSNPVEKTAIQNVAVTTVPDDFGQRLSQIEVTYGSAVDATGLDTESFQIRVQNNNLTGAYTTYEPSSLSVDGNTVTLTVDDNRAGLLVNNYYYYDADGAMKSKAVRLDNYDAYKVSVVQVDAIKSNGAVISPASQGAIAGTDYINDVLDDFNYVHLEDAQALAQVQDKTFANDNSADTVEAYIQSKIDDHTFDATADASILNTIRAAVSHGDLNEVELGGIGSNIYYHLPDNYDPAKEYPMFIFLHGSGECISFVKDGAGNVIDNAGVHFNTNLLSSVWANTEDHGLEDVILVCPQYISDNGGTYSAVNTDGETVPYDRDDAIRSAMFYMINNFSVDADRIFASGTSQGAGRTSCLLRDCADYLAGVVIQNGGFSSATSRYFGNDGYNEKGIEIHKYFFKFAAEQKISIWMFQGEHDFISNPATALLEYNAFKEMYEDAGMSADWIADNCRFTMFDNIVYDVMGETSYHSSTKPTYKWYAYYDVAAYNAIYANADPTVYNDPADLDDKDPKYGEAAYTGLVDWVLSHSRSAIDTVAVTTIPDSFGQRAYSIAVTYPEAIDPNSVSASDFILQEQINNLTGEVVSVVPDSATVSQDGKTVTLTTDNQRFGLLVDNYYYVDAAGVQKSKAVRLDKYGAYDISVVQVNELSDTTGAAISPSATPVNATSFTHEVLDDFNYVHLTDDQALYAVKHHQFANNNSGAKTEAYLTQLVADGVLDKVADKSTIDTIETYASHGDLNQVSLGDMGVNVYYHLPEGYDPQDTSKEYPMFVFLHGSGECISFVVDGAGNVIDNAGVHFNTNLAAATWATTGMEGLEDVIVLCPQYISDNPGKYTAVNLAGETVPYDRDDAIRAAMFWMIDNFNVDTDRIYASGTSQGAGRTSALLRDCADWLAGVVIQNGGFSSAVSMKWGRELENLDQRAIDIHKSYFEFAASQDVAIWMFQGIGDTTSRPITAWTMYNAMKQLYQEAGKSDEWLAENCRFTMFDNVLYDAMTETSYHSSTKPTYEYYAYYDQALYNGVYTANPTADDTYRDAAYGIDDYTGMVDWLLSRHGVEKLGQNAYTSDKLQGYEMPFDGLFEGSIETAQGTRTWKEYIPEQYNIQDYQIMVTIPNGWETNAFLNAAGWYRLADEYHVALFALEPLNQQWGVYEDEMAYFTAVIAKRDATTKAGSTFLVSYGEIGSCLQDYVSTHSTYFSSAAFIDGGELTENQFTTNGALPTVHTGQIVSDDQKVLNNMIPLAVCFVNSDLDNVANSVSYWRTVNHTADGELQDNGMTAYFQNEEIFYVDATKEINEEFHQAEVKHSATPRWENGENPIANVYTLEADPEYTDGDFSRLLYEDFLCKAFRYGSTIWSNTLTPMPDYEAMGVERAYVVDGDGYKRDILIYAPAEYQELGVDLPMVMIFPGGNQGCQGLFNATGWYAVAEEYGIIVVSINGQAPTTITPGSVPSYSWDNAGDRDLIMADNILDYVAENYNLDASRIYTSGLYQFPHYLAHNRDYITAQGSVSSGGPAGPNTNSDVPCYQILGEGDYGVSVDGFPAFKGNYTTSMNRAGSWFVTMAAAHADWLESYAGATTPIDPDKIEALGVINGRYDTIQISDEDGDPMVRYSMAINRGHSFLQSDFQTIWETWFCKWSTNEVGESVYNEDAGPYTSYLKWYGQAELKLKTSAGTVAYVDPNSFASTELSETADLILVSHNHPDHNGVTKPAQNDDTVKYTYADAIKDFNVDALDVFAAADGAVTAGEVTYNEPLVCKDITVQAVAASNTSKTNHALNKCVGFLISFEGKTIYHAADTEYLSTMAEMSDVDYAFFPIDGGFTMDADAAADCAEAVGATFSIPYHNNNASLESFAPDATKTTSLILAPGDCITF